MGFATALQAAFQKYDVNRDGYLDREEVAGLLKSGRIESTHMPAARTIDMMIAELDADHDGVISFAEFRSYLLDGGETPSSGRGEPAPRSNALKRGAFTDDDSMDVRL